MLKVWERNKKSFPSEIKKKIFLFWRNFHKLLFFMSVISFLLSRLSFRKIKLGKILAFILSQFLYNKQ